MSTFILPLSDSQATLENVGGKGMSLAKLIQAGFPVPDGFHIATDAYRQFIATNGLQTRILAALRDVDTALPSTLETASTTIGRFSAEAQIPEEVTVAIKSAYLTLDTSHPSESFRTSLTLPVAVRSSATAEDLPEASFAGQQETYLNIRGEEALLDAVKKCWASLWTARAIAYRIKNHIDQNCVALAVVVQEMVNAEASGILFTANPINGHRNEVVINAAWGLGEAIVGGLVSPDTIVVEKATGKIKKYDISEKTVITVLTESGTREDLLNDARRNSRVLKEPEVVELVGIARRIESYYGGPQDIEWCHANDRFSIVQSRPVTALPEVPIEWIPPNPKGVYMRTSVADLMPDPLSPLYITWAIPTLRAKMIPLGVRLKMGKPVLQDDYYTSINSYAYMNANFTPRAWWWIITGMVPAYPYLLRKMVTIWREELHPEYQAAVAKYQDKIPETMSTSELWRETQDILDAAMYCVSGLLFATMGASAGAEGLLTRVYDKMARREGDPDATALLMGWDNIPVRAEKSLFDLATWCREHAELAEYLLATPSDQLVEQLKNGHSLANVCAEDWKEMQERFDEHLRKFGHIIFQLDFAEPLPLDNPVPMLENIKMYLRGEGVNPHERQRASAERRVQTAEIMRNRLKGVKHWAFVKALNWGQSMAEVREDALAEIGLGYPMLRAMLRELGGRFAKAGAIAQAEDIFWLEKDEVGNCIADMEQNKVLGKLSIRVEERKAFSKKVKQETPPPMMPMKKKFMGINTSVWLAESESNRTGNILKGVATSAGKVTAPACILHSPEDFNKMRHGDVLVAGTTTPAWTPLFAMASAVVTDIGGPLSHGSIVAREYGIPAVMGTGVATKRIQDEQVITVDGTKGEVILTTIAGDQAKLPAQPLEWPLPMPKAVLARGSFAEFVPEPVSPLFATLAVPIARKSTQNLMAEFGVTGENSYLFEVLNDYIYVGFVFTPRLMWQMIKASFMLLGPILKTARQRAITAREEFLEAVQQWQARELEMFSPSELVAGVREIFTETALYYNMAQSGTIPTSMINEAKFSAFYRLLAKHKSDPKAETFVFGSENLAIRSEKALFDLAMWAKEQPELADYLAHTASDEICTALQTDLQSAPVLREFATRFDSYLREFGHAIYDLDFAKPTPREDPAPLMETVKVYLTGKNNPYERQRAALTLRERAADEIAKRLDPLRRRWFLQLLQSAQDTAHLREDSIADMGLGHPQIRRMLRELGKRLAANGAIARSEDVYWLEAQEVDALAAHLERGEALKSFSAAVERRKAKWDVMRHIIPPTTLPKGNWMTRFFPGNEGAGNTIKGFGASTGRVTARACVMLGPEDFDKMQAGDVIVAGITTPAWTPLFARASAIVTDIGGPLSHSSIIAREYGIPAVLATGVATRRVKDGQTITVDGSKGEVLLEGTAESQPEHPPPPLEWYLASPHAIAMRMSLVEFIPDVVSPLFATLAVPIASQVTSQLMDVVLNTKGEGGYYFEVVNGYVYGCLDIRKILHYFVDGIRATPKILQYGRARRNEVQTNSQTAANLWGQVNLAALSAVELINGARELFSLTAHYYTVVQSGPIPLSTMSETSFRYFYNTLVKRSSDPSAEAFLLGLENLPLQAETSLFDLAQWIQEQAELADYIKRTPAQSIWRALQTDPVPAPLSGEFTARFAAHLNTFGHAVYDLDFAKSVAADDPTPLLATLKVYIAGQGHDPHIRIQSQIEQRQQAEQSIVKRLDPWRRKWFQKLLRSAQEAAPDRENAIADLGLTYPQIKRILHELGLRLTAGGATEHPEDAYWLEAAEVDELAACLDKHEPLKNLTARVKARKADWQRAFRTTPPAVVATNKRLSKIMALKKTKAKNTLKGFGASAGKVTAAARVLRSSEDFSQMRPGDVLVAVTTTPAWTPLFAMASAIVTDLGGPLSHSSIVAREYGIPAVLATGNGTRRIRDGQTVTVDGSAGTVVIG